MHSFRAAVRRLPRRAAAHLRAGAHVRILSSTATAPRPAAAADAAPAHPDPVLGQFTDAFLGELDGASKAASPEESALLLKDLVRAGHLRFTDMQDHPEKFFLAHRLLTTVGLSGFGIRFTVQFNLFAGSILGLGGPEQVALLDDMQARGELGCFLLTEKQAGVLSGLVVETTATFDEDTSEFVLATPNEAAHKNWISQGYTAEHGVVVARLLIKGEDKGPHAFLMRLRDAASGEPAPGVTVVDMGLKTVANDLDNAAFGFDGVRLPRTALLNKFCEVEEDGAYVQTTDEKMRIEVIGQRLMTGRMAIAEAALVFAKGLHAKTRAYADSKVCNGLAGEVMLSDMPQLKSVLDESDRELDAVVAYCVAVEAELSHCLRTGAIPSDLLVEKIAVAKIKAIDVSVDRVHKLRLEVGSYALMSNTGFELADMLLCCKFAEGDTRILMQKIARDRLKKLQKDGLAGLAAGVFDEETRVAFSLARTLQAAPDKAAAWNEQWADIYKLADLVCARHLASAAPPPGFDAPGFQEPLVDRYQDRSDRGQL